MKLKYALPFLWVIVGCGGSSNSNSKTNAVSMDMPTIQDSSGNVVADVVGFSLNDVVIVYIPSSKIYSKIYLTTGGYYPMQIFYTSSNCTGSAYADFWYDSNNVNVIFDGTNYWATTGSVVTNTVASYFTNGQGCTTSSGSNSGPALTSTTQPYNFAAIAPISLHY